MKQPTGVRTPKFDFALWGLLFLVSTGLQAHPNQIVLGYSATWYDAQCPPEDYNYGALTHLARSFLTPRPDGSISVPDGFFNASMESMARRNGVKLLMSLGGEAPDADNWLSIARHPEYLRRFFTELDKLLEDHGYDGVDIDWEPSALTDEDGEAFTSFIKALRARFPHIFLTTALGASNYWVGHFRSWPDIYNNVDYINVMVYGYSGAWGGKAAYDTNLYPAGAYPSDPGSSVDGGMRNLRDHHQVPPSKLLVGLSFWGDQFHVNHIGGAFPKNQAGQGDAIAYPDVERILLTGAYEDHWDGKALVPYVEKKDGARVVCYENTQSIHDKCEYAKKAGFAGVMIWHLGADLWGKGAPLMDSVASACRAAPQTFSRLEFEQQVDNLSKQVSDRKGYLDQINGALQAGGGKVEAAPEAGVFNPALLAQLSDEELQEVFLKKEKSLGVIEEQITEAQQALQKAALPKGKALAADKPLAVSDFKKGSAATGFGTQWFIDQDHNNLGTQVKDPKAFMVKGGPGGFAYAARFSGHFGRSVAPWPYAVFLCDLDPAGGSVDLSVFKALQAWVKGDGKRYEAVLDNPKVLDYASFRSEFTAPVSWTEVTLPLDSFHQPTWGAPVDRDMGAVKRLTFEPSGMNDEDFDLWIDGVVFDP